MTTLDNLRKAARRWLKSLRAGDSAARTRLVNAYPDAPANPTLRDVQHALARARGYESWAALKHALLATAAEEAPLPALLLSAGKGDVTSVGRILDAHPEIVNERGTLPGNSGLRTALHFGSGHEAVVKLLLERGADPNIRDEGDNAYPLHFAAERGHLPIVRLLIEHGADPIGAGTTHQLDVLGWAVCFDSATHLEVARYLLAHGARHTLLSAVAMGDAETVAALAAAGEDVNQRMDRTNHRRTPLHLAVVKRQPTGLAPLIAAGADLNVEDAVGFTPLDQAVLSGDDEMAGMLIEAGATITLPAAIVLQRHDIVERLARENPDLFSTTDRRRWGRLVVHASRRAPARVLERLLDTVMRHRAGLSIVNMTDDEETAVDGAQGYSALHEAAFYGNNEAVSVLLAHGANPRVRDGKYCATPAGWAAHAGHDDTARLILEGDIDVFDAIAFDRADRLRDILDRDPGAIDRPFGAYATCGVREAQWWPTPNTTPLEWATKQRKQAAVQALIERGAPVRSPADHRRANTVAAFLESACWDERVHGRGEHRMHDRAAQRLLAHDPTLTRESLYTAIVCGDADEVGRLLASRPALARQRGGARGWTPILYLAYTRFTHQPTIDNALAIARLLLACGANPNDFYMAGEARYSVLAGAAGEGEQDAPRQPYAAALFDLFLERGAEPFDVQVLYNTHFSGDMQWWLELVYERTRSTARAAAWRDADWWMFDMGAYGSGARFVLETAIKKRKMALARWALAHGANPDPAPARDPRFPQVSLYEFAQREGAADFAELLALHGAKRRVPVLDIQSRFVRACFALDREGARELVAAHPDLMRSSAALFAAAARDRADVLALLLDLGFPLDLEDETGKRPLHEAVVHNALGAAQFLIARGADIDARDSTYDSPPIGWAAHGDQTDMVDLLSGHSRHLWTLCFRGYVTRVADILREDRTLALGRDRAGSTLLWWLPEDEGKALAVVDLLLAAGVDPLATNNAGHVAADWARRRGMTAVADRLDQCKNAAESSRTGES